MPAAGVSYRTGHQPLYLAVQIPTLELPKSGFEGRSWMTSSQPAPQAPFSVTDVLVFIKIYHQFSTHLPGCPAVLRKKVSKIRVDIRGKNVHNGNTIQDILHSESVGSDTDSKCMTQMDYGCFPGVLRTFRETWQRRDGLWERCDIFFGGAGRRRVF